MRQRYNKMCRGVELAARAKQGHRNRAVRALEAAEAHLAVHVTSMGDWLKVG